MTFFFFFKLIDNEIRKAKKMSYPHNSSKIRNRKIVETTKIDIFNTHIHDLSCIYLLIVKLIYLNRIKRNIPPPPTQKKAR